MSEQAAALARRMAEAVHEHAAGTWYCYAEARLIPFAALLIQMRAALRGTAERGLTDRSKCWCSGVAFKTADTPGFEHWGFCLRGRAALAAFDALVKLEGE